MLYGIVGIAACFCLICGGILFGLQKDTLYINDIPAPAASKAIVPADENTKMIPMTYQELLAYYGIEQLPDAFGEELTMAEQSYFVLYQGQEGNILYDTNILYYNNSDRSKTLSIAFAKAEEPSDVSNEDIRSRIGGVSILLAAFSDNIDRTAYWADFELNGAVQMTSDGLSEDAFINVIQEFIKLLK